MQEVEIIFSFVLVHVHFVCSVKKYKQMLNNCGFSGEQ